LLQQLFPEQYDERLLNLTLKILRGESVSPDVYMDHVMINKENVDLYYPERLFQELNYLMILMHSLPTCRKIQTTT
jgi:hypothetical protein